MIGRGEKGKEDGEGLERGGKMKIRKEGGVGERWNRDEERGEERGRISKEGEQGRIGKEEREGEGEGERVEQKERD